MEKTIKGTAHVFNRNDINTDEIIPARRMTTHNESDLAKFAMEDLDANFVNRIKGGDFIVAGENFGCGSSREHAIWALRGAGVKMVIAKSFARIFLRNAINNGFIAIELAEALDKIKDQDKLEISLQNGLIKNLSNNTEISFHKIPEFVFNIAEQGGLLNTIKR